MTIELVPIAEELPDVLPTERLLVNGMAIPELRRNYRHIENWRNVHAVTLVWLWTAALAYCGVRFGPFAALAVFIVMGPMHARFAILMHESAHKLLFSNKRANDFVGSGSSLPGDGADLDLPTGPLAHHREEFGPRRARHGLLQRLSLRAERPTAPTPRDAVGISGYKNFKSIVMATTDAESGHRLVDPGGAGRLARTVLARHRGLVVVSALVAAVDDPVARIEPTSCDRRTRRDAEERRPATHDPQRAPAPLGAVLVRPVQHRLAPGPPRHMGVPWHNLPAYHRELQSAGYVTAGITFENYFQLWRKTPPRWPVPRAPDSHFHLPSELA